MKKWKWIIAFAIIILVILIIIKINKNKNRINNIEWNNEFSKINKNEFNYKEDVDIKELKKNSGIKGEDNIYDISTEYDGRKSLRVKSEILYKVAFAGIIKKGKPELGEIDSIFDNYYPKEKGIWISETSRGKFLNLLEGITNEIYKIDETGYLKIQSEENQNDIDKELNELLRSNKRIIIDISNIDYEVDVVSRRSSGIPF